MIIDTTPLMTGAVLGLANKRIENYKFDLKIKKAYLDEHEKIFKNIPPTDKDKESSSIFVSYPGTLSPERIKRSIIEYTQFNYFHVIISIIVGLIFFPNLKNILVPFMVLYILFYYLLADRSCNESD